VPKQKTLYRDRKDPYVHPPEQKDDVDSFTTHDVGTWMYDPTSREKYRAIYGQASLDKVDLMGTCAENINIDQVGGTFPMPGINVWGGDDIPEPEVDHTGQICVQTAMGPMWVDAKTITNGQVMFLVALDNIRRIVREEILKALSK
jgi:hypothetical protein